MRKIKIPSRFLRIAPNQKKTVAIHGKGGLFRGRVSVPGKGDVTRSQYLIRSMDLNKDGKIGPNERGGVIRGRAVVRASRRARGYERRV